MEELIRFFATWAVIGYFVIMVFPKPKNKPAAFFQLLISGPLCWLIFIPASLDVILKNRRDARNATS
jgi:hypothetical protein